MKTVRILGASALIFLTGCAVIENANRAPVLGAVEHGIYTHPDGAFQCPVPTSAQGFAGDVDIRDAFKDVKTVQRVIPVHERRPGDPSLRNEIVYPIRYKPRIVVTFDDRGADKTKLEIGSRRMRPGESRETALKSGYGGNYGLLLEGDRQRGNRSYALAVAQLPYWTKGQGYMGADLWLSFLHGDDPAPDLDVIFNIVEDDMHYWFLLRNSSLEFVPEIVNPKDLEAVFEALKADPGVATQMEERLWALVKDCRFGVRPADTKPAQQD